MTAESAAEQRFVASTLTADVAPDGGSEALSTSLAELHRLGPVSVGLWDAGPGSDSDVEVDEVFLVLSGSGSVEFDDGSTIQLEAGTLVRLHAGDRTTWHITERVRKLYIALE